MDIPIVKLEFIRKIDLTTDERILILEEKLDKLIQEKEKEKENSNCVVVKTMDNAGRITSPQTFRKILGINESTQFEIFLNNDCICLRRK